MNYSGQNITFTDFKLNGFYNLGEWRPLLFIPFFLMLLLSTAANSILIYLIKSQSSLHSPMYVLIGFMSLSNLIMPISFVPHMLLNFLFNWSGISLNGCLIQMFCIYFTGSFNSTLLFWMAIDRYFAICKPLYYHKYMEICNFVKFVIPPVMRNAVLVIIMVSLAGKRSYCTNIIDHSLCEHMPVVQLACGDISINNFVGLLNAFVIPITDFVLITLSYVVIFNSVFKSGKPQMKAINTCITHLFVLTVSFICAVMAFLIYRIRNNISSNSRIFISILYLLGPSCCNPIIYGWRTKEIRQTFFKFMNIKVLPFLEK
ncbi:Olfactory receptor 52A1 HPFH1OR [Triplophysa tibetana]|uniref:Olfactory receptor n=1 Tax=Triplophysa tibetana TaxID=1572043 RepID=A0A5A9MYY5_9TELE|nr:Olfactory receptor 52A1 HPFH1OR [Triplophysa tibetana]